jgi:hypothetical protein
MLLDLPLGLAFLPSSKFLFFLFDRTTGPGWTVNANRAAAELRPGGGGSSGKKRCLFKGIFLIDGCLAKKMRTLAWLVRKVHSAILSKPPQGIKNLLKMKIRSC